MSAARLQGAAVFSNRRKDNVHIRPAELADVAGLAEVHAGRRDPWSHPGSCAVWLNHRLLAGYLVDVAVVGRRVVGHAEWLPSPDAGPLARHLFLGLVQVHRDARGRGVGRALIRKCRLRAAANGCPLITTRPAEKARGIYRQGGFEPKLQTADFRLDAGDGCLPGGWRADGAVPLDVVGRLPMRLGWTQPSSFHMWLSGNRPVRMAGDGDDVPHPVARRSDGTAWVQLQPGYGRSAVAVAWAEAKVPLEELVAAAEGLLDAAPADGLVVSVVEDEADDAAELPGARHIGSGEVWSRRV